MSHNKVYTASVADYRLTGSEPLSFELIEVPPLSAVQRLVITTTFPGLSIERLDAINTEELSMTRYMICFAIDGMKADIRHWVWEAVFAVV
jgi:hypothetical protein